MVNVSDDICSNLGPGIAMVSSKEPNISVDKNIYARYITSIGNVRIISGLESNVVNLYNVADITSSSDTFVLSKRLADLFRNEKETIFTGDNENYSMYLIKEKSDKK